jgi:6-pyruvoyltetrahydropterin/6-carboxytetrahydropterin synthase
MTEQFRVLVQKDSFVFSAAHFITFGGNICERLHGHNYKIAAEIFGPLDENHYVVDFIAVREILQAIARELDHHVLLPTTHPMIRVTADDRSVEARFEDRRWVFPRGDCILLPVPNTTTELLAKYIGGKLIEELKKRTSERPERLRVRVDENEGQWAVWETRGEE